MMDVGGDPGAACARCGAGGFCRPLAGRWRCATCEPPALPPDVTGWSFCTVPGAATGSRDPLPYPPGWPGWPDEPAPALDPPDPAAAPLGKCRCCRFVAPLGADGHCGKCVHERLSGGAR